MKGQRNSRQRELVSDAVMAHQDHPSADQIYLEVRAEEPRISRGTVYRNLNLLAENGEVQHVKMPGVDRFDWRVEPHYHLLCTGCGALIDVSLPYRAELDQAMARETGYRISGHRMTFEGLCPDCARANESAQREGHEPPADGVHAGPE